MSTKKHTSFSIIYIGAILALIAILGLPILTFYQDSETNLEHAIPRLSSKPKVGEMLLLKSIDSQSTIRIIEEVARHCNDLGYHLHLDTSSVQNIWEGSESIITKKCERTIIEWLEGKGKMPVTWETFVTALEDLRLMELSDELRQILSSS